MELDNINTAEHYVSNVHNLTELWKAMGARAIGPDANPVLHASERWPDRLWFSVGTQPERSEVLRLVDVVRAAARPLLVPVWCRDEPGRSARPQPTDGWSLERELRTAGFTVLFEQTLMALNLTRWSSDAVAGTELDLHDVKGETSDWADIASRSFGYTVPAAVTDHLREDPGVSLILARSGGQGVGTGLVYAHGGTAGLHMLGVVPQARRKGIAPKIMLRLLDDARARGFGLATLQASRMGERLYRELGFAAQGRILNFRLERRATACRSSSGTRSTSPGSTRSSA